MSETRNESDMNYIFQQLTETSLIHSKLPFTENSVPVLKEIFQKKFDRGIDMKNGLCLFDSLVTQNLKKERGIYQLDTSLEKWTGMNNFTQLKQKSSEAKVYFTNIFSDIQIVVKTPKNQRDFNELIREYFIGITYINRLRILVPNFMYSLGICIYAENGKDKVFTMYEKIPGETLEFMLKNSKITFPQFLSIYVQILLALEVAQRNMRFCHWDLHTGNVILRPIEKEISYTIVLDDKKYEIVARDYIPVIIDFGMSSVKTKDNRTIGITKFQKFGIFPYLVQGADMYKLLFYSVFHSTDKVLHRQILELFMFYGKNDPYQLLINPPEFLRKVALEYVKKVSHSSVATNTPLDFADWLLKNFPETPFGIRVSDRDIARYIPSVIIEPESFDLALSYMREKYFSYLLVKYTEKITNKKIRLKNKKELLERDRVLFSNFKNLTVDRVELISLSKKIIEIPIESKNDLVLKFEPLTQSYKDFMVYLQFFYMMKELNLRNKVYKKFLKEFTESENYLFYKEYGKDIENATRWSETIIN